VYGLDASGALQDESITLNGTANVATASTYTMVHRMIVTAAGSSGANEGVITATAQTDGTVTAAIAAGDNQTLMAIYRIPAGKTGYLLNWYASLNGGLGVGPDADVRLLAEATGEVFATKAHLGLTIDGTSHFQHVYVAPPSFAALTTVKVSANTVTVDNSDISAGFDLLLVDN
jgi:hypothetical protein